MALNNNHSLTKFLFYFQTESNARYIPTTQIIHNADSKQLTMHIKMEMEGCYQAAVSYGDIKLRNGDFNILVISGKSLMLKGGKLPLCSFIFIVESHREQPLIMLFMLTSPTFGHALFRRHIFFIFTGNFSSDK